MVTWQKLVEKFPSNLAYQVWLGGSYCNYSTLFSVEEGQSEEKLKWLGDAIATLNAVLQKQPAHATAANFLANSYENRADTYRKLGQHIYALEDWNLAIERSPKDQQPRRRALRAVLRMNAGQVAEAIADVTELAKSSALDAEVWYNLASVFAIASTKIADKKTDFANRAIELLANALKAGWADPAKLRSESNFNTLHDRHDFMQLLAELEKKFPPAKELAPPPREKK